MFGFRLEKEALSGFCLFVFFLKKRNFLGFVWFSLQKEELFWALLGFCSKKRKKFFHNDKFPIGLRVLDLEYELTCLKLLDTAS